MGHKYVKEEDTFSTSQNGTVPKPTAQEVSDGKVLSASGSWVANSGGGGGSTVSFSQTLSSGTESGEITIDGVSTKIYAPTPIDTLSGLSDTNISTPTNGQVLKYNGSQWTNANESGGSSHTYSTSEQVIGTWIDGKPLYEKTVQHTETKTIAYKSNYTCLAGLTNVDVCMMCQGSYNPDWDAGHWRQNYPTWYNVRTDTISLQNMDTNGNSNTYLGIIEILRYTKTTDTV